MTAVLVLIAAASFFRMGRSEVKKDTAESRFPTPNGCWLLAVVNNCCYG
ncbi:hypothetical protein [uncultured Chryseobacterium sp.]|nr:hypothetical protein [uncultured Chryseobacterium sp.]